MGRTSAEGCAQRKVVSEREASLVGEVQREKGHHCGPVYWEASLVVGDLGDRGDVVVGAQWEDLATGDLWAPP